MIPRIVVIITIWDSSVYKIKDYWNHVPSDLKRIYLFITVAGLLPWLTFTSYDIANYVVGAEQILSGKSVYRPTITSPKTGLRVPAYPYLPVFAILLAIPMAPFSILVQLGILPPKMFEAIARIIANSPGYIALLGIPFLGYVFIRKSNDLIWEGNGQKEDFVIWGILFLAVIPALWFQVLESGTDTFVAFLTILGTYFLTKNYWFYAGICIGLTTFKFTGIPFAAVIGLIALVYRPGQVKSLLTGGIVSQVPSVIYYLYFPSDLIYIMINQGQMSLHSGQTNSIATAPFRWVGLENWYIDVGFYIVLLVFVILGVVWAVYWNDLLLGFASSYLSTSYFAPVGEVNLSVLIILLMFGIAINFHIGIFRKLGAGLLTFELYRFIQPFSSVNYISSIPFPWWEWLFSLFEFSMVVVVFISFYIFTNSNTFALPSQDNLESRESTSGL